jgi:hypothetical protein
MAVTLLKHYERFAGLSTDVKPANAPMGSTFFEWDTSKLYTLSPAGWVEKKGTIHGDVQLSGSNLLEVDLKKIADDLPFTTNINNFTTPNNPVVPAGGAGEWDASRGLHSPKIYYNPDWDECWRIYYAGIMSDDKLGVGLATATDPMGTWTKHVLNPLATLQPTEAWEDATYGNGGSAMVYVPGTGYVFFFQYKNLDGKILTGRALSADGITFTNKIQCVFDSVLDRYNSVVVITGVIWEPEKQRFVASLKLAGTGIPLVGAVAESSDGINWTTLAILNANVGYGDSGFAEPFDVNGLVKFGSTYILFAHRWITINYGSGVKDFKSGLFAVSTDLRNWYISDKNSLPQTYFNSGRYGAWCLGHDAWWGVHTGANTGSMGIELIMLPINKPYYAYLLNEASIANGNIATSGLIVPDGKTKQLKITVSLKYGATAGKVKLKIVPQMTLPTYPNNTYALNCSAIEFVHLLGAPTAYIRDTYFINDVPEKFFVQVENLSGAEITNVSARLAFQE